MPSSACYCAHRRLHPFPTRRSSDLRAGARRRRGPRRRPRVRDRRQLARPGSARAARRPVRCRTPRRRRGAHERGMGPRRARPADLLRSEEHTSELQSLRHLVCRLLLATAPTDVCTLSLHDALPIYVLVRAGVVARDVDRVFATGGSSLVPAVRAQLAGRFGAERLVGGEELTSVAWGLAARARQIFSDRKSTRLNSSHLGISYAVFCLLLRPPTSAPFPYTTLFRSTCWCAPASWPATSTACSRPAAARSSRQCARSSPAGSVQNASSAARSSRAWHGASPRAPGRSSQIGRAHV